MSVITKQESKKVQFEPKIRQEERDGAIVYVAPFALGNGEELVMPLIKVDSWVMRLNKDSQEWKDTIAKTRNAPEGMFIIFRANQPQDDGKPLLSIQEQFFLRQRLAQQKEGFSTGWKLPEGPDDHFKDIAPVMHTHVICQSDGTPVGALDVTYTKPTKDKPGKFYLEYNAVEPELHGKKIGLWALAEVILDALQQDPDAEFHLDTSARDINKDQKIAFGFYKPMGFEVLIEQTGDKQDIKGDTRPYFEARRAFINERFAFLVNQMSAKLLAAKSAE